MNDVSVLYVEDDALSQRILQMLLHEVGVDNVVVFANSEDFLRRAEALEPPANLIFLDIHVKPYTGFDMLRMLRESPVYRDTRVIALTASVMNEEIQQLRRAGFNGCLAKPIDGDQFPDTFAQILAGQTVWKIIY